MGKVFSVALLIGSLMMLNPAYASDDPEQEQAVAAAQKWLKLVDNGKYGASWDQAAPYFKSNVKRPQWEQQIKGVREPLGKSVKRELQDAQKQTSVPGAPDGEYEIIQFKTEFANKKEAIETITPMKDKDGTWRVSGYFIR